MSKQPRLIDADKLLDWVKSMQMVYEDMDNVPVKYANGRVHAYSSVRVAVQEGTFDPTPPVQPVTGEVIK